MKEIKFSNDEIALILIKDNIGTRKIQIEDYIALELSDGTIINGRFSDLNYSTNCIVVDGYAVYLSEIVDIHKRSDYEKSRSSTYDLLDGNGNKVATIQEEDMVNHPSHYISETGLETIDVVEAFTSGLEGIEATDTGNVIKYICRWKKKNGLQDLNKALWYLKHLIKHVEKTEKEND